TDLEKYYLETAERQMEAELVDTAVANSQVEYPGVLREAEVDEDVREFLAGLERRNVTLDDFLSQSGQTRESLTQDFESRADRRIQRGLVLGEIARKENLIVTEEDVDREIASRAEAQQATPAAMQAYIEANNQTEAVRNAAQMKKVLGFLTAAAIITDKVVRPGEEQGEPSKKAKSSPSKGKQPKAAAAAEEKPKAPARKGKASGDQPAKTAKK
ncbi:MAG TPA: hypothetical protein VFW40_10100, partial [Capsulimonadaceae bacterium]|nr:hypothetical protein [Capsulimonadaceae bacterium]